MYEIGQIQPFKLPIVSIAKISWRYKKDVHVNYYFEIPMMEKNKI